MVMLKNIKRLGLALAIMVLSPVYAESSLVPRLNALHSMKANFVQTIEDNHGKAVQTSTGNMALIRPGKFRWDTKKPIPQLIIANETKLWIYDPDLEQVTIRNLHKATGESPALILTHENASLESSYTINDIKKKSSKLTWYQLLPHDKDSPFESVEMGFNSNDLEEMRLYDHLGHSTHIVFKAVKANIALADSLFNFKPAANIDVIDETKRKK